MAKSDWIIPALGAAAMGYGAFANSRNDRRNREQASEENDLDRRYQAAVRESELNPYRHHLSQAQTLGALDLIARGGHRTPTISMPGITVPKIEGGFEYTPNPDMATAAQRLQQRVAGGQGAPSMTDPNNWGQNGAVDLNGGGAPQPGTAVPRGTAATRSATPATGAGVGGSFDPSALLAGVPRRNEGAGGVGRGAMRGASTGAGLASVVPGVGTVVGGGVGLVAGALAGAFTKNAKTAATDVSVDQARQIIAQVIQQAQGRSPSPDEVTEILRGQGWQPGHRWVGEAGLLSVVRNLQQHGQASASRDLSASYDGLFG